MQSCSSISISHEKIKEIAQSIFDEYEELTFTGAQSIVEYVLLKLTSEGVSLQGVSKIGEVLVEAD